MVLDWMIEVSQAGTSIGVTRLTWISSTTTPRSQLKFP